MYFFVNFVLDILKEGEYSFQSSRVLVPRSRLLITTLLIRYQMRSLMQNNCAVLITKHQSLEGCQHFLFFLLVIFL